jgi:hypothetical protein
MNALQNSNRVNMKHDMYSSQRLANRHSGIMKNEQRMDRPEFGQGSVYTPKHVTNNSFENSVKYSDKELNMPSSHASNVNSYHKNALNPQNYDEYTNWQNDMSKNYDNFFQLATPPQNNPYGVAGYPPAMKKLEQQHLPKRPSTPNNPFMNVPIKDYGVPQRYSKASNQDPNPNFYSKLFRSPDDALWHRQASEAQFATQAVNSNPNEQIKFAEWLWGKNFVCKSGSIYDRYGFPTTPDSMVCNGFNAASPENGGSVDNNYGVAFPQGASFYVDSPNYGYGFGGIEGAIQPPIDNQVGGTSQLNPTNLVPNYPPNYQ